MHIVEEIELKDNKVFKVYYDEDAENPREMWDHLGLMICFHKRYTLGDKHEYRDSDYSSWEEVKEQLIKDYKPVAILPVYMYDHSGLTVNTTGFNCPWDSGQIGWILASPERTRDWYMVKRITKDVKEKVKACLVSEVKEYDTYLRGDVYGFKIIHKVKCDACGHDDEEVIDSYSGFYGDVRESGMLEHIDNEYAEQIKKLID